MIPSFYCKKNMDTSLQNIYTTYFILALAKFLQSRLHKLRCCKTRPCTLLICLTVVTKIVKLYWVCTEYAFVMTTPSYRVQIMLCHSYCHSFVDLPSMQSNHSLSLPISPSLSPLHSRKIFTATELSAAAVIIVNVLFEHLWDPKLCRRLPLV